MGRRRVVLRGGRRRLRRRLLTVIDRAALPAPPLDVPPALESQMGDHGWLAAREWRDVCERTQVAAASRLAAMVSPHRCPLNYTLRPTEMKPALDQPMEQGQPQ